MQRVSLVAGESGIGSSVAELKVNPVTLFLSERLREMKSCMFFFKVCFQSVFFVGTEGLVS